MYELYIVAGARLLFIMMLFVFTLDPSNTPAPHFNVHFPRVWASQLSHWQSFSTWSRRKTLGQLAVTLPASNQQCQSTEGNSQLVKIAQQPQPFLIRSQIVGERAIAPFMLAVLWKYLENINLTEKKLNFVRGSTRTLTRFRLNKSECVFSTSVLSQLYRRTDSEVDDHFQYEKLLNMNRYSSRNFVSQSSCSVNVP